MRESCVCADTNFRCSVNACIVKKKKQPSFTGTSHLERCFPPSLDPIFCMALGILFFCMCSVLSQCCLVSSRQCVSPPVLPWDHPLPWPSLRCGRGASSGSGKVSLSFRESQTRLSIYDPDYILVIIFDSDAMIFQPGASF